MSFKNLAICLALLGSTACNKKTESEQKATPSQTELSVSEPAISNQETSEQKWDEIEIMSGILAGTYLNAGDNAPAIIMVPGSGPTDRNGNSLSGMKSNALKFLAHDLAAAGISTIRVDKYGQFGSADAGNANEATVETYARDYRAWVSTAIETTGQSCAFLLGHSEGGMMITAAAQEQDNICGVILVASPGRTMPDILRDQLSSNPANKFLLDDAMAAIDSLERGEKYDMSDVNPALMGLFHPDIQDFWISIFKVDPAKMLGTLDIPKLVIQGSHDVQVKIEDAKRLTELGNAELVILEGISHVLKPAPEDFAQNIATYHSPDTPIDPQVARAIAEFIGD